MCGGTIFFLQYIVKWYIFLFLALYYIRLCLHWSIVSCLIWQQGQTSKVLWFLSLGRSHWWCRGPLSMSARKTAQESLKGKYSVSYWIHSLLSKWLLDDQIIYSEYFMHYKKGLFSMTQPFAFCDLLPTQDTLNYVIIPRPTHVVTLNGIRRKHFSTLGWSAATMALCKSIMVHCSWVLSSEGTAHLRSVERRFQKILSHTSGRIQHLSSAFIRYFAFSW